MSEQVRGFQRRPECQAQRDRLCSSGGRGCAPVGDPGPAAQRRRCGVEDRPDGVVELPQAAEAGRGGDIGHRQGGGFDENSGGLCPLRPGQRRGSRAQFRPKSPLQLTRAVAEPAGQARNTLAVHHPVGDEPDRPTHPVGADVPLGRSRRGVRSAPLTRPEAGCLGGGRGRQEIDVLRPRCGRRATWAAVDAGTAHAGDEPAVEPLVPGADGAQPASAGVRVLGDVLRGWHVSHPAADAGRSPAGIGHRGVAAGATPRSAHSGWLARNHRTSNPVRVATCSGL